MAGDGDQLPVVQKQYKNDTTHHIVSCTILGHTSNWHMHQIGLSA